MRKRILVTGGAGFLGSHLCERLLELGHEVVCLDNFFTAQRRNIEHLLDDHRFELVRHDVTEPIVIEVDEIYHLACPASPVHYQRNPVRTIRTAVQGTLHMLDMAREVHARILIASTSEVYGDPLEHPQREPYWGHVNPIGPRACYDEGKRCAEALTVSYARQYGVATRIARIFNTYGPRMHEDDGRVVSNFVLQALRDRADHDLRRRLADALVLLVHRSDRGLRAADGAARRSRSGQPGQPAREHRARARRDRDAPDAVALEARDRAAPGRRSHSSLSRHRQSPARARLGTEGGARGGAARTIEYMREVVVRGTS